MADKYYLQDKRSYVGNDILFWADGGGYTTDVSKAEVFTKDSAVQQNKVRETDVPWPKAYIDAKTRPAVDMQYVKIGEALDGTGITLNDPPKPKFKPYKCYHCGRFISLQDYYGFCPHCDGDNTP